MQTRAFDRATIRVANRSDASRTATADEISGRLRTGKERNMTRIDALTVLALLIVALAPMAARAGEDEGIHKEIAALKAQVAALQSVVGTLQTNDFTQQGQITALQGRAK